MDNAQLINQTSGDVEWYTPVHIIEAARRCMGGIDLDPASCENANQTVKAASYFTLADNGLSLPWYGRVWMNHPFSDEEYPCKPKCKKERCKPKESPADKRHRGHCIHTYQPGNRDWINKLMAEYGTGNISQACCICFASTSEAWFQPLFDFPQCYLSPRVHYLGPDGKPVKGCTKGSVVTYLGTNISAFVREFSGLGRVMVPALTPLGQ